MIGGSPWTPDEDDALLAARSNGASLDDLPTFVEGRSRAACERRLCALETRAKLDAERGPRSFVTIDIPDGLTLNEAVTLLGKSRSKTLSALESRGYRLRDGVYRRGPSAMQVEDHFYQQRVSAPPSAPCFLCGCRVCACPVRIAA